MNEKNYNVGARYLGEKGEEYLELFTEPLQYIRTLQAQRFAPYCSQDDTVLDFGCCEGFFLRQIDAAKRIGVEANLSAHALNDKLMADGALPVELHTSLEDMLKNSIDVAMSNHCLEHVPNPFGIVRGLFRVLKPGGRFVLIVPFDDIRQKGHRKWQPGDINSHLYTWSPMNIGNLLTEAGFEIQSVRVQSAFYNIHLNGVANVFGRKILRGLNWLFSKLLNRREVMCVATKPL